MDVSNQYQKLPQDFYPDYPTISKECFLSGLIILVLIHNHLSYIGLKFSIFLVIVSFSRCLGINMSKFLQYVGQRSVNVFAWL